MERWIQIVVQIRKHGKVSIVVWSLHIKWTKTKCCIEPSKFHHKIFFLHENYFYMFYSFHFHTSTVVHKLSFQLNYSKKICSGCGVAILRAKGIIHVALCWVCLICKLLWSSRDQSGIKDMSSMLILETDEAAWDIALLFPPSQSLPFSRWSPLASVSLTCYVMFTVVVSAVITFT